MNSLAKLSGELKMLKFSKNLENEFQNLPEYNDRQLTDSNYNSEKKLDEKLKRIERENELESLRSDFEKARVENMELKKFFLF